MVNQVARDDNLLETTRDCFCFVTKFFEPINVSATHIYHSALELSPLSSIVRRLYYNQQRTPSPRVVAGTSDSWNQCVTIPISTKPLYGSYTWSPCGRFIAAPAGETVKILDALSSELLSTLVGSNPHLVNRLMYSPDGRSLACLCNTAIIIWDIQTGGVAKEIQLDGTDTASFIWSLDGKLISVMGWDRTALTHTLRQFDITSGTALPHFKLLSQNKPHLWAHNCSFQVLTTKSDSGCCKIEIFQVREALTNIESFHIESWDQFDQIQSFSPTTYRISILVRNRQLRILDIRNANCLLEQEGSFKYHCFSSDASLFAASSQSGVIIWKYASGVYSQWMGLSAQDRIAHGSPLQFSPTLSSISGCSNHTIQVQRLDGPPILACPDSGTHLAIISPCGTFVASHHKGDTIITITNLRSPTPPQFIDTEISIQTLALTGNVLLALGVGIVQIAAWRLTEEGGVHDDPSHRRADFFDRIWTASSFGVPIFSIEDQTVTIKESTGTTIHTYHMGTGRILEPTLVPQHSPSPDPLVSLSPLPYPRNHQYTPEDMLHGYHYPHHRKLDECGILSQGDWPVSWTTLQEGWVMDPEGKHRFWIPVEWRAHLHGSGWLCNIVTLWICHQDGTAIVMF